MAHVLAIVGPTAVGKTSLAFLVAKRLLQLNKVAGIDLISADSRQVYQGLEIVSGVDLPKGFLLQELAKGPAEKTFFQKDNIRIFGVSLLKPDQDWSVSQFQRYAHHILELSWAAGRLPIVVGGTGLYQRHLLTRDQRLHVPPNLEIRQRADAMSPAELLDWLEELDSAKASAMNESDRANPRRLVRAIETTLFALGETEVNDVGQKLANLPANVNQLTIGLTDSIEAITQRIGLRVAERLDQGALAEVERLVARYPMVSLPIYSTTGVKPLLSLSAGLITTVECRELWTRQERHYAKRQLTWWKKQAGVRWFEITDSDWPAIALDKIEAWWNQ